MTSRHHMECGVSTPLLRPHPHHQRQKVSSNRSPSSPKQQLTFPNATNHRNLQTKFLPPKSAPSPQRPNPSSRPSSSLRQSRFLPKPSIPANRTDSSGSSFW